MSTTKKDYVALAEIIKQAEPAPGMSQEWSTGCNAGREYIAIHLADYFVSENRKFDRARFLQACGVDWAVH